MAECPGLYQLAKMKDGLLARVRIPGQRLNLAQMQLLARATDECGNGVIELTSRGNIQLRGIKAQNHRHLLDLMKQAGLLAPRQIDRIRNITIDTLAGFTPDELINCRPLALELAKALEGEADSSFDVKFSFCLDGGGGRNLIALKSDIGVRAVHLHKDDDRLLVFQLYLAGEKHPFYIKKEAMLGALLAIANAGFKASGNSPYRMKHVLKQAPDFIHSFNQIDGVVAFDRPLEIDHNIEPSIRPVSQIFSVKSNNQPQAYGLCLSSIDEQMKADQWNELLALFDEKEAPYFYLSPLKELIILPLKQTMAERVLSFAKQNGLAEKGGQCPAQIISCIGAAGCERGQFQSRRLATELAQGLATLLNDQAGQVNNFPQKKIHISACGKGCRFSAKADFVVLPGTKKNRFNLYKNLKLPVEMTQELQNNHLLLADQQAGDLLAYLKKQFNPKKLSKRS